MSIRRSEGCSHEDCSLALSIRPVARPSRPSSWISCNLPRRSKWPARDHWLFPTPRIHVFTRTLPDELKAKLQQKNLGLDYRTLDRAVAKGGDIKYIDFRKDWSPHFKRLCIMPDGRLVETGGLEEFAQLHGITSAQAKVLVEQGGTLEVNGEILACQIVNGQPAVARFTAKNYAKAKELVATKGLHIMDALSEVAYNDPVMMRALVRKELSGGR